jgi:hypothetical protein
MADSPVPDDAGSDASLGLADVLRDAITDLLGAEAMLAQLAPGRDGDRHVVDNVIGGLSRGARTWREQEVQVHHG